MHCNSLDIYKLYARKTGESMSSLKKYLIGLIVGLLIGLWTGVNIGKDRPIWSNPFAEPELTQKAKDVASDVWKDAKEKARESLSDK